MTDHSQLILHVGDFKTATSSIQNILARNREMLCESLGVLYPETGLRRNTGSADKNSIAHHLLFHANRNFVISKGSDEKIVEYIASLKTEIEGKKPNIIIISTELFSNASFSQKKLFVENLALYRPRIVYSVRRPDDFLESMLNQVIKNGKTPGSPIRKVRMLQNILDWESIVGPEMLSVHYFDKGNYSAYLKEILRSFGINSENIDLENEVHDNPTMTQFGLVMRKVIFGRAANAGIKFNRLFCHNVNVALDRIERDLPMSDKVTFLTQENRNAIMDLNREQMEEVSKRLSPADLLLFEADMNRSQHSGRNADVAPRIDSVTLEKLIVGLSSKEVCDILNAFSPSNDQKNSGKGSARSEKHAKDITRDKDAPNLRPKDRVTSSREDIGHVGPAGRNMNKSNKAKIYLKKIGNLLGI